MKYAARLLTHRGKPTGYEVYEVSTRKKLFFYRVDENNTLSDTLKYAEEHADRLNGELDEKTSKEASTSIGGAASSTNSVDPGGSDKP